MSKCRFIIKQLLLLCCGLITASAQMTFVHPGAVSSKAELDFVKEKIKAGAQPWSAAYTQMLGIATASNLTSVPTDENGQRDFSKTIYANALAWWYSDNVVYANRAIAMLKVWATTFGGYVPPAVGQGNQAQLDAAWMGSLLAPAAELMRGYAGWALADRDAVVTMFKTKFYPALNQMSTWNGNNDLTQIEAMMCMAVFCEDEAELNMAVTRLRARNPAYFYLASDPAASRSIAGSAYPGNWFAPKMWVDGVTQETCRDNNHHAQYGSAAAWHAAEAAWHQGVDVWTENTERYTATMELLAKQLTSGTMQGVCTDNVTLSTTGGDPQDLSDILEIAYNHYHNRKEIALPETEKCLQLVRNNPSHGNSISPSYWNIFFETLTHADLVETPIPLCSKPNLGPDQSVCGKTNIILSTTIPTANKTFVWSKDKVVIPNQSTPSLSLTQAGTYRLDVDSAGCKTSDEVVIGAALSVNLGSSKELCNSTVQVLDAGGANGTGANFAWSTGAKTQSIAVSKAGTYSVTVSAANCASVNASVVVTSKLLNITADTLCQAGAITLNAIDGGSYRWFDVATGGIALGIGATYSPTIAANKTFYVEDAGGVSASFGKVAQTNTAANIWSVGGVDFTGQDKINNVSVLKTITLNSLAVYVVNAGTSVTINLKQGATTVFTKTLANLAAGKQTIGLDWVIAPGNYVIDAAGTSDMLSFEAAGSATFPYSYLDYVSFTNNATWQSTWYGLFYDWKITIGNVCARTPVNAVIDANNSKCLAPGMKRQSIPLAAGWNLISINVRPTDSTINSLFAGLDVKEVKTMDAFWMKSQADVFNGLKTITAANGYMVNMLTAGTLTVVGVPVQTRLIASPQQTSWTLIGCPYQLATPFTQDFNATNCWAIKNFEGFWKPNGTLNSISDLEPGKAYFKK